MLERGGFQFMDPNRGNQVRPVEEMLGEGGMNTVRLRFVANGYLTRLRADLYTQAVGQSVEWSLRLEL